MTQIPSRQIAQQLSDDQMEAHRINQANNPIITVSTLDQIQLLQEQSETQSSQLEETEWDEQLFRLRQQSAGGWWQRLSVKTKATVLAVVLGTAPVLAIGAFTYYFINRSMTRQVYDGKQQTAVQLANEFNTFLTNRFLDVQMLGRSPLLADSKVFESTPNEDKEKLFERYIELFGVYNSVALFDSGGDVILQSKGDKITNQKSQAYFQDVLKTEQPTIDLGSATDIAQASNIQLAAPVKDSASNNLIGVVRFQLPLEKLEQLLKKRAIAGERYYLINGEGNYFLTSGDKGRIGKSAKRHFAKYSQLQAVKGPTSFLDVDPDSKVQQLVTYVPLKDAAGLPKLNYGVLIASDVSTALAPQRQLLLTLLLGTVVTALIVGAIAAIIASRATRLVLAAAIAVEKIGKGELSTRLEFQGGDEIASLVGNINDMASRLETLVQEQVITTEQVQLLANVAGSRALELPDLLAELQQPLAKAREVLHVDRVMLYRFTTHDQGEISVEAAAPGFPLASDGLIQSFSMPESLLTSCRQGLSLPINTLMGVDLPPQYRQQLEKLEVKARLVTPIVSGEQLLGLIIADHCLAPYEWQPAEIEFLKQLAIQISLVINRVTLLEQTEQQAEEQRQLKEGLQMRALELLREVDPISKGDLTTRAKVTADEIGTIADSYNATVNNLRKIVVQVQEATQQVVTTTTVNETSVQSLAAEALRQAEEIGITLQQIEQMAATVQEVASSAEQAEKVVQQAAQTVEEGDTAMNRTINGIQAIRSTVAETAKKVKHLGESSQKISTVIDLISSFTAQTNMLALNASIEASRAGEQGRGFAVVASEVRALAQRSAEATEEIRKLIVGIQTETNEVVAAMEAGTEQVVTGTKLVDETRQSLNKITVASDQISHLVEAIVRATVVQFKASETVTQTMRDVAKIANKTSTEANQVSSSFEEMRQVAQSLQASVEQFKVG
ncbi:MAG: methyl-accepting chemotaxis protein [Kovacikia sp.]